jgi:hypothetical protein
LIGAIEKDELVGSRLPLGSVNREIPGAGVDAAIVPSGDLSELWNVSGVSVNVRTTADGRSTETRRWKTGELETFANATVFMSTTTKRPSPPDRSVSTA